jgi:Xaa-Pro aminopeptidase
MNFKNEIYKKRRQDLVSAIKKEFPQKNGIVLVVGRFEQERHCFRQDSTFYYLTGVEEPGSALIIDLDAAATLFIPATTVNRAQWLEGSLTTDQKLADQYGFTKIEHLGQAQPGYTASPLAPVSAYENMLQQLASAGIIFTCIPGSVHQYIEQKFILERLKGFSPKAFSDLVDISALVARMRRKKSLEEIELIYKAVEVTVMAQEAAACSVGDGVAESQVQAGIEYVFIENGGRPAFPSIVGSGKQSTVLHYCRNNQIMRNGDVVVVDIGVELDYYCADLTRTYPA